ncbi:MAG: T9SS type A sorting domain-containing protein [Bacteroidia bacterium]|nr:T9SS type A sorting domain-containing protein [Bacteroidia bacterium]
MPLFTQSPRLGSSTDTVRSTIGFTVHPSRGSSAPECEEIRIELNLRDSEDLTIRVTDASGRLFHEQDPPLRGSCTEEIEVSGLDEGTYYFEVTDGFYYQIKEVRL